jgi:hypothetical protein
LLPLGSGGKGGGARRISHLKPMRRKYFIIIFSYCCYLFFLTFLLIHSPFGFIYAGHSASDGKHHYLKNWMWWAGMSTSKIIFLLAWEDLLLDSF